MNTLNLQPAVHELSTPPLCVVRGMASSSEQAHLYDLARANNDREHY